MQKALVIATFFAAGVAEAAPLCDDLGFAGLLAKCNRGDPIELTLASGQPVASGPVTLQSGAYYEMRITADGNVGIGDSTPAANLPASSRMASMVSGVASS